MFSFIYITASFGSFIFLAMIAAVILVAIGLFLWRVLF